jgi:hypothetical protein
MCRPSSHCFETSDKPLKRRARTTLRQPICFVRSIRMRRCRGVNRTEDGHWYSIRLAQMLRPFSIHPRTIRFGEDTAKGYNRIDFEDAFERYL